jgi:hypothetical protein
MRPAHGTGCVGKELAPGREGNAFAVGDVEVGLVQQGGGTERELGPALVELTLRDPVQLLIQNRKKLLRGRLIARLRTADEAADGGFHALVPRLDADWMRCSG